jgi:hypothetical protein
MVLDFYDAVDEIEEAAFDACDRIEAKNATGADENVNDLLEEARGKICGEGGKLARRLNSLNLRFSRRPPRSRSHAS